MIQEIVKRRTIREYINKSVSDKDILEIIKAAQFAPTGMHTRAVEFIVVQDKKRKDQIAEIMGQKQFIKDAPVLIIPATDTTKSSLHMQDLSIASSYMQLQITALGLGSVWKHVHADQIETLKEMLNIPAKFTLINMIALGYGKEKKDLHSDAEFDIKKIHHEQW